MRLRVILLLLTLLTFLSALIGVYVHYTSSRNAFLAEAESRAQTVTSRIQRQLSSYLAEQLKPVRVMAGLPELSRQVFGLPCSIGKPREVSGLATAVEGPEYATCSGLVQYGFRTSLDNGSRGGLVDFIRKIFVGG